MPEPVSLHELAGLVGGEVTGEATITDVSHDSRTVTPGCLFAAVPGFVSDGHDFLEAAVEAGAVAVCVSDSTRCPDGIPAVVVDDVRAVLGPLAAAVHGDPSRRIRLVGITGTNGKTTVSHLVESIASAAGLQQAIIGTVGARINGTPFPVVRTTPEATDFQRLLATMVELGVDVAAVEVSSHALALGRVDATRFRIGAFTNLSQDHLDFHDDMDEYFAAKRTLFDRCETAVVWIDDPAGRIIAGEATVPVLGVGFDQDADIRGDVVTMGLDGSTFEASGPGGGARIHVPLPGRFNMANSLIAAGIANALGVPWDTIADGIGRAAPIPGRFEIVETSQPATVVVDYAHTPEGITAVVDAARELVGSGRVIAVAGAAGDRDRAKRPLMGAAAATADVAVITSDNPRSEDPHSIVQEVVAGAGPDAVVEVDRRQAIATAVDMANPGDVVLILGKGHEQTQEIGGEFIPFDDRVVAREVSVS